MESLSEQISLTEALSEARLPQLPYEWTDKNTVWVRAIVKVQKVNTKINWAIASNDGEGNPIIEKDFGTVAKIAKILEIRPYSYLIANCTPDLRNKADITNYLVVNGYDENQVKFLLGTKDANGEDKTEDKKKADRNTVKKWVLRTAIETKMREEDIHSKDRRNNNGFAKEENKDLV